VKAAALAPALAALLGAGTAVAGPDFTTPDRARPLAASEARADQAPTDELEFMYDSSALLPAAQQQLAAAAAWLARNPSYRLVVEGHADRAGTADYNQMLATRRAEIARSQLIATGVPADRIVVAVYGETRARQAPTPRALDRRVVILASKAPVAALVSTQLDADAVELSWTHDGSRFRETRGISPVTTSAIPTVTARNGAAGRRGG
jgi:outer membrane protein OmpA-like peptidoglycan-associated protein